MSRVPTEVLPPPSRRTVWALAWPAAASVVLNNAFRVVDQYSVQWLGSGAQAAIGSCTFILIFFFAIYELVAAGTGPLIARATGARDPLLQRRVLGNSIVGGLGLGAVVCVACILGAPWMSGSMGLSGEARSLSETYLRHLGYAGLPLALSPVVDAAFIAMGRTRLVMGLHGISTLTNLGLNFLLIYGLDMGIAGAAWASGISRALVLIPGVILIWRDLGCGPGDLRLGRTLQRITRVGLPMSMNTAAYALVYWGLLRWVISPLGPEVNASLGIGFSALEGFTWPAFHGVSLAVASLVGRYMGAGQPEQAQQVGRIALPLSTGLGLLSGLVFYLGAEPLCGLFTDDPGVLQASILYARILAFSQVFVAWEALAEGVLAGAGDTKTVFWWSAPIKALRIPLGFLFAMNLGWGAAGIWWAINLTSAVKALAKGSAAARGRWASLEI